MGATHVVGNNSQSKALGVLQLESNLLFISAKVAAENIK
jgi:hypothetical protein